MVNMLTYIFIKDYIKGSIALGTSNKYEQVIHHSIDQCKRRNAVSEGFFMKMLFQNRSNYYSTNTTSCPFRRVNFLIFLFLKQSSCIFLRGLKPSAIFHTRKIIYQPLRRRYNFTLTSKRWA